MANTEQPGRDHPTVIGFDGFYRLHRDPLYRALVMTTRDPEIAIEAVDEAMTRASERWDVVGTYDNPAGWVYRVALNWARSVFRRRRFISSAVEDSAWDTLPDPDVNDAVASLPYRYRSVIVARFYLDWSTQQIADGLDIPLGTVKSRLHRALARLEQTLGGQS